MVAERNRRGAPQAPVSMIALLLLGLWLVDGAPASPEGFRYKQPDGSRTPMLFLRGDEKYHYMTDKDGYTVFRDEDNGGWYVYAKLDSDGRLVSSGGRVGHVKPKKLGLEPGLLPPDSARRRAEASSCLDCENKLHSASIRRELRFLGEKGDPYVLKILVVLIRFSDHVNRTLPSPADIDILLNKRGGDDQLAPAGSLRDVWLKNSLDRFDIDATATNQWITLPNTEKYYANGEWGHRNARGREAFNLAMNYIDENMDIKLQDFDTDGDGILDLVAFVHSGVASEHNLVDCETDNASPDRFWSHYSQGGSWTSRENVQLKSYFVASAIRPISSEPCLFDINAVGMFAHEIGHHLGLEDLYGGNEPKSGNGIGFFGFMASVWGWDRTARSPPHLSPYSKMRLNWVKAIPLDHAKEYELEASVDIDEVYIIDHKFPNDEYLIVENRFAKDFDAAIPGGGGLAIYHFDDGASHKTPGFPGQAEWPRNNIHYVNALLPADGRYDLEKGVNCGDGTDLFRAGVGGVANAIGPNGINIDNKPHPNTNKYQGGIIEETGIVIKDISELGPKMTFRLEGGGLPPCEDDDTVKKKGKRVCPRARRKIEIKGVKKVCKKKRVKNNCKESCSSC